MIKHGIALAALLLSAWPANATETEILVRTIAADAKFVGTSRGGFKITLRDVQSGNVLAEGVSEGGTGDTRLIMMAEGRSPVRADNETAAFRATVDIETPTLVQLEVEGPTGVANGNNRVTSQRWVMPGDHLTAGDGWVVEVPGLTIDVTARSGATEIQVDAQVELLCGCPITPDGIWRAEDYQVSASLWIDDAKVEERVLEFYEAPGRFSGALPFGVHGPVELIVHAKNIKTGNSGLYRTEVLQGR